MPEKLRKPDYDRKNAPAPDGVESVPQMSYSSSPVQGLFGFNHLRRAWNKRHGHGGKDSPDPADELLDLAPMQFAPDEAASGPLAAAGSAAATAQLAHGGRQTVDGEDLSDVLPAAPRFRYVMGMHRWFG